MYDFRELSNADELRGAADLLANAGLNVPEQYQYGTGCYFDEKIVGTGFYWQQTLMGICVHPAQRNNGLVHTIITHLMQYGQQFDASHFFIFTKKSQAHSFLHSGFSVVAATDEAALLEFGWPNFSYWAKQVRQALPPNLLGKHVGAIVMNANPFTLGHQYLVEEAAAQSDHLLVFVVQEDVSECPFAARLRLVEQGCAHIPDCTVLSGGAYMVSRSTFPSYFTGSERHAAVHAGLDATLFATTIAPALGITHRFVGTEPKSPVTALYNLQLEKGLAKASVGFSVHTRKEVAGVPISASLVRELAVRKAWDAVRPLVPETTYAWLTSKEAEGLFSSNASDVMTGYAEGQQ